MGDGEIALEQDERAVEKDVHVQTSPLRPAFGEAPSTGGFLGVVAGGEQRSWSKIGQHLDGAVEDWTLSRDSDGLRLPQAGGRREIET
jgi:hypothetical protein